MHTEREKKQKVKIAFTQLNSERARKKQRKMEPTEKEKKEARSARQFYVDKIRQFQKSVMSNADKFEQYSMHELNDHKSRLESFREKLEAKPLTLNCAEDQIDTSEEDEELESLCTLLSAKITKRIGELMQPQESIVEQKANAAVQNVNATNETVEPNAGIEYTFGEFHGLMNEWHRFARHFKEEVHENEALDDQKKYNLLMQACHGSARPIVANTQNEYKKAWQQLNNLYGEAYMTIQFCLSKIMETEQIHVAYAEGIQYIKMRGARCVQILNDIFKSYEYESFITVMMANKLDSDTLRAWDRHRAILVESWANASQAKNENSTASKYLPSWQDFEMFLDAEIVLHKKSEIWQSMQGASTSTDLQNISNSLNARGAEAIAHDNLHNPPPVCSQQAWQEQKRNAPIDQQCKLCDGIHMLYKCEVFLSMTYDKRWECTYRLGLCQRCFRQQHGNERCANKRNNDSCAKCYERYHRSVWHNSTLCPITLGLANEQPRSA